MKKRLSSESWYLAIVIILVIGLFSVLGYTMRATALSYVHGVVSAEIPVLAKPIDDFSLSQFKESARTSLTKNTAALVLNKDGDFILGNLEAFSTEFHNVRNKFLIESVDGQPQTNLLLQTTRRWQYQRKQKGIDNDKMIVFVPSSRAPVAVVVQIMADLKQSEFFDDVILANGML